MVGKLIHRAVTRHCRSAVIWAMLPLAVMNGRSIAGCISPTGEFSPGCHCWSTQNDSASGANNVCRCHCSCCQGKACCCKVGASCCSTAATNGRRSSGNGYRSGERCRPVTAYVVSQGVKASISFVDAHQAIDLTAALIDVPTSAPSPAHNLVGPNTGPPPDNLVIVLQRFLI